jgi:hypothetical protein
MATVLDESARIIKLYYPISSTMTINARPLVFQDVPNASGIGTRKTLFFDLPFVFLTGSGPKYIHIRHVKALHFGNMAGDIKLHSSIVSLAPYDDSFACFCNETLVKPKKFHYSSNVKTLSFWFCDMYGRPVDIDAFVIELLLEWVNET